MTKLDLDRLDHQKPARVHYDCEDGETVTMSLILAMMPRPVKVVWGVGKGLRFPADSPDAERNQVNYFKHADAFAAFVNYCNENLGEITYVSNDRLGTVFPNWREV